MIDRLARVAVDTPSLAALLAVVAMVVAGGARAESDRGAELPPGAARVEEGRWRTGMSWDATLKWYGKIYPRSRYEWIDVVNRPGLRAVHIRNDGKGGWEGINIYEHEKRVRIYVLERS